MTPDPKYLAMKNANGGTRIFFDRAAIIGNRAPAYMYQRLRHDEQNPHIPSIEPNPITNIEDIRIPSLPSYPFPLPQSVVAIGPVTDVGLAMIENCAIRLYPSLAASTTCFSLIRQCCWISGRCRLSLGFDFGWRDWRMRGAELVQTNSSISVPLVRTIGNLSAFRSRWRESLLFLAVSVSGAP